ncbi:uncharacterized protein [Hyperolius riggenbachi]|uniref:uncharacterized protein n=1 Tax=Hyperolius riggenbachi TaxID=752182 RepID=UPI0035A3B6A0
MVKLVQAISTVKNGLVCPSCFSLTSYACIPDTTTVCTGNEIQCATYSMHNNSVTSGPYIIMVGCATANLCTAPNGVMSSIVIGNIIENITCFNPSGLSTTTPSTSKFLSCINCTSSSQALCTGPSMICPNSNDVCTSIYTATTIIQAKITSWSLVRGCGQPTECYQPRSLSNQVLGLRINTGCCTSNDCTPPEPAGKYFLRAGN